jgi:hypothetical protein
MSPDGGRPELLGPAHVVIHPQPPVRMPGAPGARSHLADGRVVSWSPPLPDGVRAAVDAEIAGQPVPASLARRFGIDRPDGFWPRWTAVEVACKLLDVPVVVWLSQRGLSHAPLRVHVVTFQMSGVVVSVGIARST